MNQVKDDYLKRIYHLGGCDSFISNKDLSQALGVTPASVSEMILRLEKEGYLDYVKYKGVKLSKQGLERAVFLIRAHRLWETFLANNLDYHWKDIHDDAELLEHASSKKLINHLDDYLGNPKYCPHGTPIPSRTGEIEQLVLLELSEVSVGETVRIVEVPQDADVLASLEENNIKLNDEIIIKSRNSLRDTTTLKSKDYELEIGNKIAANILVKREQENE